MGTFWEISMVVVKDYYNRSVLLQPVVDSDLNGKFVCAVFPQTTATPQTSALALCRGHAALWWAPG